MSNLNSFDAEKENAAPTGIGSGVDSDEDLAKASPDNYGNQPGNASGDPAPAAKGFATRRGALLEAAACDPTLTPVALRVLMLLALRWADAKTGRCWPAKGTIADALAIHDKTVQKALRELRERGWIMVAVGAGQSGTNVYQVIHSRFEGGAKRLQKGEPNRSPNLTIEPKKKEDTVPVERAAVENSDFEDGRRTDGTQHSRSAQSEKPIAESEGGRVAKGSAPTGPSSKTVASDGPEWGEWRDWLLENGVDPNRIPRCTMRDKSRGYLLPLQWPPGDRESGRRVSQWLQARDLHSTRSAA